MNIEVYVLQGQTIIFEAQKSQLLLALDAVYRAE